MFDLKRGPSVKWTVCKIDAAIDRFVEENHRLPVALEFKTKFGLPSRRTAERILNQPVLAYCRSRHGTLATREHITHTRNWTEDTVVAAILDFTNLAGRPPQYDECSSRNGLPSANVLVRLGLTVQACLAAGTQPEPFHEAETESPTMSM